MGRRLGKARLEEGIVGIARLHALIGEQLGDDGDPQRVAFGIETDRGTWVQALIAAGYHVYAINPLQVASPASPSLSSWCSSPPSTPSPASPPDGRATRPTARQGQTGRHPAGGRTTCSTTTG
jgi:hypothetical protein